MTIWKYTSDLQLDTSFGTNGVVTHNDGANYTAGSEIVLDSADDIYVGGAETSTDFSDYDAHVWKYTSNGTIMNSFGASGEIDMGSTDLGRMYMDSSNNLFVGLVDDWDSCAITSRIIKYDTDGNLDTNFGSSGIFNFENKNAGAGGFATDSDGNLLVSSYICTGSVTSDAVIWILDSDTGELITVSGSGGKFIFSTLETPSLRNIVIDSEGRAVTCGVNNEGVLVADEPPYFIMRVR